MIHMPRKVSTDLGNVNSFLAGLPIDDLPISSEPRQLTKMLAKGHQRCLVVSENLVDLITELADHEDHPNSLI